jgi:hypothetical protein
MDAVYAACPIKRKRSTRAEVEQLERQIYEVLKDDNPQSVRHVFYRTTDPRLPFPVPKSDAGYDQVQNRIAMMRRSGALDYDWIVDHTRRGYHTNTFDDAEDFINSMAHLYRGNLWRDANWYVEVWAESRSIAGVLQGDCKDLAVSLYPTGGFSSITLAYEAAQSINEQVKPVKIFYCGDFDPAGILIDVSLEAELRSHLDDDIDLDFQRLAITEEQIERYSLPGKPRKEGDRRALHIRETVEAEAMPASILRALVREHIEALLPPRALEVTKIAEESERNFLKYWTPVRDDDEDDDGDEDE